MYVLYVNHKKTETEKNISLLRFLRDELHITSAKDGCSEGACGTCTVLVNGKATRACTVKTSHLENAEILTVEGLSAYEKKVYTYAFGEAGAVQCGFCIPGMVICAKSLLDQNLNPTEKEIRYAIRNNICRCTGYVKIVKAIELAAKIFRENLTSLIPSTDDWQYGSSVHRIDVEEKVLGSGQFTDDVYMDNMCFGSSVRSKYPRARVLSIDTSAAKTLPGVICVLTASDIPGTNFIGHLKKDQPTLVAIGELTHYLGDSVALVCAKDEDTLQKAKELVKVEYEVLPYISSAEEGMKENAPLVFENEVDNVQAYKHVSRGDAKKAIEQSAHVINQRFHTPWTEHAFLEPECCVAYPTEDGGICLLTTDQSSHTTLHECSAMLNMSSEQLKVQNMLVGGGFGGKEDMSVQHHAALLCYYAKLPVKVKLTRKESLLIHPKRHSFDMDFTIGCDENGIIQGVMAKVISDTGAFASLGGPVLERACTHAAGPYNYQNFEIEGRAIYTNNPPAGAFRGFGVTQTCFCTETLLNEMADLCGITPWEIRMRNAIRPGQELPNGQIVDESTGLVETLNAIKPYYDDAIKKGYAVGLACAMKNAGVGVGIPDWGRCKLIVEKDNKLHIYSGASCIGQGIGTVLVQMVCTETSLHRDDIVYERSNTWIAPDSGDTSGSRQTLVTGEACRRACENLNKDLKHSSLSELVGKEYYGEYLAKTDPLGANVEHPVSHVAYGYATQMCIIDKNTGLIKEIVAAHDVGKAVNPKSCEGQIEGGVVMSTGYALTEQYPIKDCKPTASYGSLGLFRAPEAPHVKSIVIDKPGLTVARGAIGIGEITSIPTAPAIADAYYRYDGIRRTSLPLCDTPYEKKTPSPNITNGKKSLKVNFDSTCIGCMECVRTCALAFSKTDEPDKACIRVTENANSPYGYRPVVCTQCGLCAKACSAGAITQSPTGVYIVNKSKCTGCNACKEACPLHVFPVDSESHNKCIACGLCAKACPMEVLRIQ